MAHGGQEFTFSHGCGFGGQLGLLQFELQITLAFQLGAQAGDFLCMIFGVCYGLCDLTVVFFDSVPECSHE